MKISILTVFPELYKPFLGTSLIARAQQAGTVSFSVNNLFGLVTLKERIDAPTFGPTAGMLLKPEVIQKGIQEAETSNGPAYKIFFSPHGKKLDQSLLSHIARLSQERGHLMLLPARYEGMDARVEEHYADEVISVGDFVLMGGDIPAMMVIEGILRLLPGVVGREESVTQDSFSGALVDYPEYTAPVEWMGMRVPDIVRSGNHGAIELWRKQQAVWRTALQHFQWFREQAVTDSEKKGMYQAIPSHYVALMHTNVIVGGPEFHEGETSVTSIDIHDISRSCKTYGIKNYFVVTPLADQQKIVSKLLDFWHTGVGVSYNPSRHQAVKQTKLACSLQEVIQNIEQVEGVRPIIVATSARLVEYAQVIGWQEQGIVWSHKRPVLFLFGTGQGLAESALKAADYVLLPVEGLTAFNHLSVRSAVAIILDRWLGLSQSKAGQKRENNQ
jgi:tRNA (guanine37-N1)-methyltransferase